MVSISQVIPDSKVHFQFPESSEPVPLQIETLGFNPSQETIRRFSDHHQYQWLQTVEGSGRITVGNRTFSLGPRQAVLLVPGRFHSYQAEGDQWSTLYITFGGPLADSIITSLGLRNSVPYQWSFDSPFADFLSTAIHEFRGGGWGSDWNRSELVYRFLLQCRAHCRLDGVTATDRLQLRLAPLLRLIEERLGDPNFGIDEMANSLRVSTRYLNELFRNLSQSSPYHYLRQLRISRAQSILLNEPALGIKEVAARVGFRDQSQFILAFRQSVGQPPNLFRKSMLAAS